MAIPRRIIQTAKSQDLSPAARAAMAKLKLLHPDWEHRFFDDAAIRQFVSEEFPQYRAVFDAFPRNIQRIDFFRYLAIHRLGGFYFDLDVFLSEELSPLLEYGCVFPFEELSINRYLRRNHGIDWEVGNYAFGAERGHPYLAAVIENCVRSQNEPSWVAPMMAHVPRWFRSDLEVLNTTGPGALTRTLAEQPHTTTSLAVLFPEDVRDSKNWHQFGHYGVHLMDGSWRDRGSYLHRRMACLWEAWAQRRLLAESHQRGPRRELPRDAMGAPGELLKAPTSRPSSNPLGVPEPWKI